MNEFARIKEFPVEEHMFLKKIPSLLLWSTKCNFSFGFQPYNVSRTLLNKINSFRIEKIIDKKLHNGILILLLCMCTLLTLLGGGGGLLYNNFFAKIGKK